MQVCDHLYAYEIARVVDAVNIFFVEYEVLFDGHVYLRKLKKTNVGFTSQCLFYVLLQLVCMRFKVRKMYFLHYYLSLRKRLLPMPLA